MLRIYQPGLPIPPQSARGFWSDLVSFPFPAFSGVFNVKPFRPRTLCCNLSMSALHFGIFSASISSREGTCLTFGFLGSLYLTRFLVNFFPVVFQLVNGSLRVWRCDRCRYHFIWRLVGSQDKIFRRGNGVEPIPPQRQEIAPGVVGNEVDKRMNFDLRNMGANVAGKIGD